MKGKGIGADQGASVRATSWPVRTLGELILEAQPGFACGERKADGVIQVRMNNVDTSGRLTLNEFVRVPADSATVAKFQLAVGDVIFNNTNSTALVGKSATFLGHAEPIVYSNHFTRLRPHARELLPGFLAFWLQLQWRQGVFAAICNRWVGQSAVKGDKLMALPITLPPIEEQALIVKRLTKQMCEIERATAAVKAQIKELGNLPGALLRRELLGGR